LQRIIRETFVELHSTDWLAEFKAVHEDRHDIELPALPAHGSLDIKDVLTSPYFFG
jgi:DNA-directed RNA polymerase